MNERLGNPFNITKAVDFSDQEINDYWVDLPGGPGFQDMAKPTSPMPMLILGGKGSGKTHLMRYFSYPLQKLRHLNAAEGIARDGYVGIYLRCGGLNAARFIGKGQEQDKWAAVFAYYMDIWLAQLVIEITRDALGPERIAQLEPALANAVAVLFDTDVTWPAPTLSAVLDSLRAWQRELDTAVNNAAISRTLNVSIRSSPSRLAFGVPRAFTELIPELAGIQFLYLIDELENLTTDQQRYINTLIREREAPCSFRIGARLYGIRTYDTYSAGETNKEGSEYERLFLDDHLRHNSNYPAFARHLCASRLLEAGYFGGDKASMDSVASRLPTLFEVQGKSKFSSEEARIVVERSAPSERPYFRALKSKLLAGLRAGAATGLHSEAEVEAIIGKLSIPEHPLLEKANVLLLYKDWSAGEDLKKAAAAIAKEGKLAVTTGVLSGRHKTTFGHFHGDLLAQLYAEVGLNPLYIGIDTFITMSRGLPRNLLVILKHVFQWAVFNGETPFQGEPVSRKSQRQGVLEAAQWFSRDAEVLGEDGENVQRAIKRLAELFRELRFADKPAECSLSTFSMDRSAVSADSLRMVDLAEKWSLLIRVRSGQKDRNTHRVDAKYQINSMLAPLWDLPISRRGAIALNPAEVNAIFDPACRNDYDALRKRRAARMTAPWFGGAKPEPTERLPLFRNG